jgi:cell division protein FtsB
VSLLPPIPTNFRAATALPPLIKLDRRADVLLRAHAPSDGVSAQPARRSKIWELAETLHCSVIGTCLSNAELRHTLARLGVIGIEGADDHELHVVGVMLAGRRDAGAKLLQRALDRRHALAIKQYGKAKDEDALRRLWDESMRSSDIPGAYWALLSHPVATEAIVKKAFQDVHMLSHLVGAANRADIRRLRQLEQDNGALTEKLHRQQLQLRDGFTSRDETIRQLNALLARHHPVEGSSADRESAEEDAASAGEETSRNVIADLNRKLGQETTRRERLEQRLSAMSATMKKTTEALQTVEAERDALRREIESLEDHIAAVLQPAAGNGEPALELSARTILYVGGRPNQIPQLKSLVERTGARFLHHDGGIEHSSSLLPGLISRADVLLFPIDCISHDAVATLKRLCRQLEKPYLPLRTASLATLAWALTGMATSKVGGSRMGAPSGPVAR